MRFSLSIIAIVSLAVTARASYDLVFVADEGTNSVHRFDGTSGAYLGQFGKGRLYLPQALAVNAATGLAYVASYGTTSIQVYNYSTGLFLNEFTVPMYPRSVSMIGSDLLISGDTGLRRYTTSGALVTTYNSTDTITGSVVGTDGLVYAYNYSMLQFQRYAASGAFQAGLTNSTDVGAYPRYSVTKYGAQNIWVSNSGSKIELQSTPGMTVSNSYSFATQLTAPIGIAAGHASALYVSGRSTASGSPEVIAQVSALNGRVGITFGSGIIQAGRGVATVVAPEPASMVGLELGVLLVAKRRQKR